MSKENEERLWKEVKAAGKELKTEIEKLSYVLVGVMAATNNESTEKLKKLKKELDLTEIHVSEYKPFGSIERNITLKVPRSSRDGCEEIEYMMQDCGFRVYTIEVIIALNDMEKRFLEDEAEAMPGEPSSFKNDGLAKKVLNAIYNFKNAILTYANEV